MKWQLNDMRNNVFSILSSNTSKVDFLLSSTLLQAAECCHIFGALKEDYHQQENIILRKCAYTN